MATITHAQYSVLPVSYGSLGKCSCLVIEALWTVVSSHFGDQMLTMACRAAAAGHLEVVYKPILFIGLYTTRKAVGLFRTPRLGVVVVIRVMQKSDWQVLLKGTADSAEQIPCGAEADGGPSRIPYLLGCRLHLTPPVCPSLPWPSQGAGYRKSLS